MALLVISLLVISLLIVAADCTLAGCILVGYSIRDAAAAAGSTAAVVGVGIHAPEFCSDERMKVAGWRDGNIGSSRRRFRRSNR